MHNTIIEINSIQFITNLKAIRQHLDKKSKNTKFCLPVKANAYGHGLVGIAKLAEPYVDYFGVACLDEGITLREGGICKPILVFGAFSDEQIASLILYNLDITISSHYKAKSVSQFCHQENKECRVHIKVDTGMNRIGVRVESSHALINYVMQQPHLKLVGVYSHLASSDDLDSSFTDKQIEQFSQVTDYVKNIKSDIICHLANSGGICYFPDTYFDMVRPGILCYGYFPAKTIDIYPLNQIKPCFSLKSKVVYFKVVDKLQRISYNQKYITQTTTRVVTLPIGYGDGYRRMLSNLGEVLIRGKKYTIAGIICMDMLMVDIGANGEAYIDDEVVLIGTQGNAEISLNSVAAKCNTINYEILCGFNQRIPRIFTI